MFKQNDKPSLFNTNGNGGTSTPFALGRNITDYFAKVNSFSDVGMQTDPIYTTPFINSYSVNQVRNSQPNTSNIRDPQPSTSNSDSIPLADQMQTESTSTSETPPEAFVSEEQPQRNPLEDPLDYTAAADSFTPATLVAGAITSSTISNFTNLQNQENMNSARMGSGPLGHSMQAENNANIQNTYNSKIGGIEQLEVGIGAMAGPEGLAAGIGLATATDFISSNFAPSNVTVPTNVGTQVTPT